MKKLFSISTIAVILLSFMATSCDKENPVAQAAPAPMTVAATTTWTPKGETKPKVEKGDIEEGEREVSYYIAPKLAVCNCNGKWTFVIVPPNNAQYSGGQNQNTGVVSFMSMSGGTYKITITYTCPGGPATSVTVSITVK